jgi:membrane protein DedA with SNARE-associated domain
MAISETLHFVVQHGYLLLFIWLFAEQAALPVPSLPLLLACGALARSGDLDLGRVLLCGVAGCLLADNLWFHLGRRHGAKALDFICRVSLEPDSCVRRTEHAFLKYGIRSLLIAKFIPGLNAVAAPLAGSSGVSYGRFFVFDALGAMLWLGSYVSVGYIFSDQLETAASYALHMGSWLVVLLAGVLGAWIGWKFLQRRRFLKKLAVARISAEELQARLQAGEDVLVVDVRSGLNSRNSVVPGALWIPAEELDARHHEIPRDREVVLFCS